LIVEEEARTRSDAIVFDVVILGAGIAGLGAAEKLSKAGLQTAVIEKSDRCGGAHNSVNIGPYTFDYGSIFYEENASIFDLAEGLRERCPAVLRRQRRIAPDGNLLHYPVEPRDMLRTPPLRLAASVTDLLLSRLFTRLDGTLQAILRKRLGQRFLVDTGLASYIAKLNHRPPDQIDESFFYKRMGFIDRFTRSGRLLRASTRSLFSRKAINAETRRALYIRPASGFDDLFGPIRQKLEAQGTSFHFGHDVVRIRSNDGQFVVTTSQGQFRARSLVNTLPLETAHRALFDQGTGLVAINMVTLFVSAASLSSQAGNVLFNFHGHSRWKRATIYSRLYPDQPTTREFFAVEVTLMEGESPDPQAAFADFCAHVTRLGIAQDLKLEGSAYQESAYPLYALDCDEKLDAALKRLAQAGVVTVGRQGRFEYLPTSSGVLRRVGEELDVDAIRSANP